MPGVVVAQWLEHWWLKPVALGSIAGDEQDFSLLFSFAFFQTPLGEEGSVTNIIQLLHAIKIIPYL